MNKQQDHCMKEENVLGITRLEDYFWKDINGDWTNMLTRLVHSVLILSKQITLVTENSNWNDIRNIDTVGCRIGKYGIYDKIGLDMSYWLVQKGVYETVDMSSVAQWRVEWATQVCQWARGCDSWDN